MASQLETYVHGVAGEVPSARAVWLLVVLERGDPHVETLDRQIALRSTSWGRKAHLAPSPGEQVKQAIARHIKGPPLENPLQLDTFARSAAGERDRFSREARDFLKCLVVDANTDSYEWLRLACSASDVAAHLADVEAYLESAGLKPWHIAAAKEGVGPLPPDFSKWNEGAQQDWINASR